MEYTVQKLGDLAGISTRTLRYYDEIGLLKPVRVSSSGYRIYGQAEVSRLQHILFYRELGFGLERIKELMTAPGFDEAAALREHREQLMARRRELDRLIDNVNRSIDVKEGRGTMTDQDKFEGFKRKLVDDNERRYGAEARARYGDEAVDKSNAKALGMTQEQHDEATRLAGEITDALKASLAGGADPAGEDAQRAAELHKRWLMLYWSDYSKEAHAGLGRMYVDDERFRAHYDAIGDGAAALLRDALRIYTGVRD